jgi:hypothetical protein
MICDVPHLGRLCGQAGIDRWDMDVLQPTNEEKIYIKYPFIPRIGFVMWIDF